MTERKVYIPTDYIDLENTVPVVFLAGPIQGTLDWQEGAIEIIRKTRKKVLIASPRRNYLLSDFNNENQDDWKNYHLRKAEKNGVILFWFPKESKNLTGAAYSHISIMDLGEWKIKHEINNSNLAIGIEKGFSGEKHIRRRFTKDCPDVPILDNLFDTCIIGLNLLNR